MPLIPPPSGPPYPPARSTRGGRTVNRAALSTDPAAVLISAGFAKDFNVAVDDPLTVGIPDGSGGTRNVLMHAVGEYTTATPAVPGADLVFGIGAFALPTAAAAAAPPGTTQAPGSTPPIPPASTTALPAPDFYLAGWLLEPTPPWSPTSTGLRASSGQPGGPRVRSTTAS